VGYVESMVLSGGMVTARACREYWCAGSPGPGITEGRSPQEPALGARSVNSELVDGYLRASNQASMTGTPVPVIQMWYVPVVRSCPALNWLSFVDKLKMY
jgi:hypothetical protein